MNPRPRHRLAAVWFADICAYTSLSGRDEDAAFALVRAFQDAARDAAEGRGGTIVKFLGDGALARFDSTDDAVRAADDLVRAYGNRAAPGLAEAHPLRVGIHVGDVMTGPDGDVYGDGVNVASRIQDAADPGRIVVSEDVWRQLRHRPDFRFEPLPDRDLPGVGGVRTLAVTLTGEAAAGDAPRKRWVGLAARLQRSVDPRAAVAAGVAGSVLVAAGILLLTTRDAGGPLGELAGPGSPLPAVAVLPFHVSGSAESSWREGLVDLLSANLDGVAGIRATDSRTVLARWSERTNGDAPPDETTALEIARSTGARYAVLGRAVGVGGEVRIVAEVFDLETGSPLGQVRAEGPTDELIGLVDRLTIDVLGRLGAALPAGAGPDLARVTTDSLAALRVFLEGEARFRRADFMGAFESYGRATTIDSTFALAWLRLGQASGWSGRNRPVEYYERAERHGERLRHRDRLVLEGVLDRERGRLSSIGKLEDATTLYPDDATVWLERGEAYHHLGSQALLGPTAGESAFERSLLIDPGLSPAYIHLMDDAFGHYADAERAARLVPAFARRSPDSPEARIYPLARELVFGDEAARTRARAELDRLPPIEGWYIAWNLLWHPRHLALQESLLAGHRFGTALASARMRRGRLAAALQALESPAVERLPRVRLLVQARAWGLPVPPEAVDRAIEAAADTEESAVLAFLSGAAAGEAGRWDRHGSEVRELESEAARVAAVDPVRASFASGAAQALRGQRAWRDGRLDEAFPLLEGARRSATGFDDERAEVNAVIRRWLAQVSRARGDPREVVYLRSFHGKNEVFSPIAQLELARALEGANGEAEADSLRRRFALAWSEADPEVRARIEGSR